MTRNGSRATPRVATFPADEQTVQVDVRTVENEVVDDAHHSLTVTIQPAPATYQVSAESGTVSVVVPDDDIEISVRRASPSLDSVVEGGPEYYHFEASRNGDTSLRLKVEMFAQSDDGRTLPALKANFPAGRESMQTQLRLPEHDDLHQADYTVTYGVAEISDPVEYRRYRRGDPHTATFLVLDDDLPRVGIEVAPGSVDEGTDFQITVTRDGTTAESLTVRLSVTDSGDFSELASSSVTFAVDAAETTLTLPTDDDDVDEADGTLTVTLAADDPAYRIRAGAGTRSVTVRDDDLPVVTMEPAANVIAEGETAEFVLTRSGDLSEPLTASTQFVGRPEGHFGLEPTTRRDVTFTAGSATATLSGATIDDDRYFAYREVMAVLLQESGRYRIALPGPATFHVWALIYNNVTSGIYNRLIVTDDDEGKVWVTASADSVPESGLACFTLQTDAIVRVVVGREDVDMDITVAVTQEGDYLAAGEAGQRTVTLDGSGNTLDDKLSDHSEVRLCLDLDDDEVSEVHGAVIVEVLSTSEGDGVVPDPERSTARVTVRDDELPVLSMAAQANEIVEGEAAVFVLTRSGDLSEPLTMSGHDGFYEWHRPRSAFSVSERYRNVTFTAGSATATVAVAVADDDRYFLRRELLGSIRANPQNWDVLLPVGATDVFTDHVFTENGSLVLRVVVTDNDVGEGVGYRVGGQRTGVGARLLHGAYRCDGRTTPTLGCRSHRHQSGGAAVRRLDTVIGH